MCNMFERNEVLKIPFRPLFNSPTSFTFCCRVFMLRLLAAEQCTILCSKLTMWVTEKRRLTQPLMCICLPLGYFLCYFWPHALSHFMLTDLIPTSFLLGKLDYPLPSSTSHLPLSPCHHGVLFGMVDFDFNCMCTCTVDPDQLLITMCLNCSN
jgi:hypothetical protein